MNAATLAAGAIVGLSLGLTGGGGAIFAVPLLVYWIGVDPRTAVNISLVTVAATALVGAMERWWYGQVELRTGLLFAAAGTLTAPVGTWLGDRLPPQALLAAFAILMLVIAGQMWRKAADRSERAAACVFASGVGRFVLRRRARRRAGASVSEDREVRIRRGPADGRRAAAGRRPGGV